MSGDANQLGDSPPERGLRAAVLGPGAVGGLLAALLQRHGVSVSCIAPPTSVHELSRNGITVESKFFGDFSVSIAAADHLVDPVDALFVAVKSTSLDDALERISSEILGDSVVIPLLNGIEHVALLRARLPRALVIPAAIRIEVERHAELIRQLSPFASIGLAAPEPLDDRVGRLAAILEHAGFKLEISNDELALLWGKLTIVAPFALLTTYFRAPCGDIRSQHRNELLQVIDEVALVAESDGVDVERSQILAFFDTVPASMKSSMQKDNEEGRPIEIDAIGGAVTRLAHARHVPTPMLDLLVEQVSSR